MEGFLTIHELSTQFNISAKAIRSRLHKLIAAGKLVEHTDFIRDKYIDPTHFEWRVNPTTFMRASGLMLSPVSLRTHQTPLATPSANPIGEPGKPTDSQAIATETRAGTQPPPTVSQREPAGSKTATQSDSQGGEPNGTTSIWREMIDFLKHQIGVKDTQIKDLTEQKKAADELNRSLIGQVVQLNSRIDELLSLPPAPAAKEQNSIKVDEARETTVNHVIDFGATDGEPKPNSTVDRGAQGPAISVAQSQTEPQSGEEGIAA